MSRALFRPVPAIRVASYLPTTTTTPCILLSRQTCCRFGTTPAAKPLPTHPGQHPKNASNPTDGMVRPIALKKSHPNPPPKPITESMRILLPAIREQPGGHYFTVHIHGFPYLVREGDLIRLPFRMPGAVPGDVLRLNRLSVIGSRDFTIKGGPYIDERWFECRATVINTEAEPLRTIIKTKRRCRREHHVDSKLRFTVIRISEFNIKTIEELEANLVPEGQDSESIDKDKPRDTKGYRRE